MEIFNIFIKYLEIRSAFLLVILFATVVYIMITQHNLPPGPWGLPLIGYALHLWFSPHRGKLPVHQYLQRLASKYGDIFCVNVFGYTIVVLSKFDLIKEAFQNPLLNDKPESYIVKELNLQPGKQYTQVNDPISFL